MARELTWYSTGVTFGELLDSALYPPQWISRDGVRRKEGGALHVPGGEGPLEEPRPTLGLTVHIAEAGVSVVLFRHGSSVLASDPLCPHRQGDLSGGHVEALPPHLADLDARASREEEVSRVGALVRAGLTASHGAGRGGGVGSGVSPPPPPAFLSAPTASHLCITCPLHGFSFSCGTGLSAQPFRLRVYPTRLEGGVEGGPTRRDVQYSGEGTAEQRGGLGGGVGDSLPPLGAGGRGVAGERDHPPQTGGGRGEGRHVLSDTSTRRLSKLALELPHAPSASTTLTPGRAGMLPPFPHAAVTAIAHASSPQRGGLDRGEGGGPEGYAASSLTLDVTRLGGGLGLGGSAGGSPLVSLQGSPLPSPGRAPRAPHTTPASVDASGAVASSSSGQGRVPPLAQVRAAAAAHPFACAKVLVGLPQGLSKALFDPANVDF